MLFLLPLSSCFAPITFRYPKHNIPFCRFSFHFSFLSCLFCLLSLYQQPTKQTRPKQCHVALSADLTLSFKLFFWHKKGCPSFFTTVCVLLLHINLRKCSTSTNHFQVFQLLSHQLVNLLPNFLFNFNPKRVRRDAEIFELTTVLNKLLFLLKCLRHFK